MTTIKNVHPSVLDETHVSLRPVYKLEHFMLAAELIVGRAVV